MSTMRGGDDTLGNSPMVKAILDILGTYEHTFAHHRDIKAGSRKEGICAQLGVPKGYTWEEYLSLSDRWLFLSGRAE